MRIATIGAGRMVEALVPHWVAAGHDVTIAGRSAGRAADLAARTGTQAAAPREAVRDAEVVLFAVLYPDADAALDAAGAREGALEGKVIVDVTNPVETERFTLAPLDAPSLAAHVAARTGGDVVKAFNLAHADVWHDPPLFGDRPLVVPLAGSPRAKAVARGLVEALGCRALDVGGLVHAGYLEATAALVIRLLFGGADTTTTVQLDAAQTAAAS